VMLELGATFSKKKDWAVHVVDAGQPTTGQNPASSGPAARALLAKLNEGSSLKRATR
jgi:hypothetical protein